MLIKKLQDIQEKDLNELVANAVAESKTLEFKLDFPKGNDEGKKEFLADVSAFANSSGGDLIFGIREETGVAKELVGLDPNGLDEAILKWEGSIRTGLEPRPKHEIHCVKLANNRTILILRVPKSWTSPHRVIFSAHDKFYTRGAAGKFPMNVSDLRASFGMTDSLLDKITAFRIDRISEISNGETPIPLSKTGAAVIHLIPAETFDPGHEVDLEPLISKRLNIKPMYCSGWSSTYTYDGHLTYQGGENTNTGSYAHVYRNGIIEAAVSDIVTIDQGAALLFDWMYEKEVPQAANEYLSVQKALGISCPIYVFLSLVGVKKCRMQTAAARQAQDPIHLAIHGQQRPLDRDILNLPGAVIEDWDSADMNAIFRPMFDLVWNACGDPRSLNFDKNGIWRDQ